MHKNTCISSYRQLKIQKSRLKNDSLLLNLIPKLSNTDTMGLGTIPNSHQSPINRTYNMHIQSCNAGLQPISWSVVVKTRVTKKHLINVTTATPPKNLIYFS